jgi:hypothetical protein
MAGSAHHDAHIEVGQFGFALFLAPDVEYLIMKEDDVLAIEDAVSPASGGVSKHTKQGS